ncbi:MAG: phosphate--acyl-ACP acyltransferase [Planctomycetaceae bacterium]|nr:phosphate--acyl-ACP acyltransferase [Planctomycetaceae bacterium]
MRIAIDVMGGDHAPDAILHGAIAALPLLRDGDEITLVGDEAIIREIIDEQGHAGDPRLTIEPSTQIIEMDESPVEAVRAKTDSSIARLAWLGSDRAERPADVIISAGNTGACVAAAQMAMRRLKVVHRPGIAVTIPTFHGPLIICDVGANIVPRPTHLHQYGHMASVYGHLIHGIENPRVALLSVGNEEGKGTSLVRETSRLMRADKDLNYVGYVEGRELFDGGTDVVVTEGFTGNVVLKIAEGLAAGLFKTIAHEIIEIDPELAMRFEPVVKTIYAKHDYHEFGGAPLLGARGICMICHGSSEARTITNSVRNAISYVDHDVNDAIVKRLSSIAPVARDEEAA